MTLFKVILFLGCIFAEAFVTAQRAKRDHIETMSPHMALLEVYAIVDKTMYDEKHGDDEAIFGHVGRLFELADDNYRSRGIRVVLSHVDIWRDHDRVEITANSHETIGRMETYRRKAVKEGREGPMVDADIVMLFTTAHFIRNVAGTAYRRTLCIKETAISIIQDNPSDVFTAALITHELGHIIGLEHTDEEGREHCSCGQNTCYMVSLFAVTTRDFVWSECSSVDINRVLDSYEMSHCVKNIPHHTQVFTQPTCGNYVLEEGEECDCGHPDDCRNHCCDPHTCLLRPGAQCLGGECCTRQCTFKRKGRVCREADESQCDLPEACSGNTAHCPGDLIKRDGTPCGETNEVCKSRECISHISVCKEAYRGITGGPIVSPHDCWRRNRDEVGVNSNCGRRENGNYIPCNNNDLYCGSLWCSKVSQVMAASEAYTTAKYFSTQVPDTMCLNTIPDFDRGQYPLNGTRCGTNKICQNFHCIDDPLARCEDKCNGRGVCNSNGNCHCAYGSAPPYCDIAGIGGSIDLYPVVDETPAPNSARCGDGMLQDGEECDCGSEEECPEDSCCDYMTCTMKRRGDTCRRALSECDLDEVCNGRSSTCPRDTYKMDGTSCDRDEGACYQGTCKSHNIECKRIWEYRDTTSANDACYRKYGHGKRNSFSNCGRVERRYIPCEKAAMKCGKLFCDIPNYTRLFPSENHHRNYRKVEGGMRFELKRRTVGKHQCIALKSHTNSYLKKYREHYGIARNHTSDHLLMVADGTKCGDIEGTRSAKICLGMKCVESEAASKCHCNNNGFCDNEGNCICDEGFMPPHCT